MLIAGTELISIEVGGGSLAVLLSIIFFIIDINIPLGVAGAVPYVVVILVTSRGSSRLTLIMALLTSLLTVAGYYFSPPGGEIEKILANRFLALFVIWISAGLMLQRKKADLGLEKATLIEQSLHFEINEKRTTEDQLRRLIRSVESVGEGILMADPNGVIQWVNGAFTEITGYTAEEAIGQTPRILKSGLHTAKEYAELWGTILAGEIWRGNFTNKKKDGTLYKTRHTITPVYSAEGKLEGFVSILQDVTEHLRLGNEATKIQKLESLGILAGGLAHDFNNLLTGIMLNISIAKTLPEQDDQTMKYLDTMEKAVTKAEGITKQLLTFSKGGDPIRSTMLMLPVLKEAVEFALHGRQATIVYDIADDLWAVEIDAQQINQVISNLIINADQAMKNGGQITMTARNWNYKKGSKKISLKPGKYVEISIMDEGEGIPADVIGSIFDPYYTTKETGSGLGLFSCYNIIERHGGCVTVTSVPNEGSTFLFYLPAIKDYSPIGTADQIAAGSGRVLVMDDDEMIRFGLQSLLKGLGYDVIATNNGEEAIQAYKEAMEAGDTFDVSIIDLTIPGGMSGAEAIKQLRVLDPEIVAIVSSGYATNPIMANFQEYGFKAALPKPYTAAKLSHLITEVLG